MKKTGLVGCSLAFAIALLVAFPLANPASASHAHPGSVCAITVNFLGEELTTLTGNVDSAGHNCVPSSVPGPLEGLIGPLGLECDGFVGVPLLGLEFVTSCPTNP